MVMVMMTGTRRIETEERVRDRLTFEGPSRLERPPLCWISAEFHHTGSWYLIVIVVQIPTHLLSTSHASHTMMMMMMRTPHGKLNIPYSESYYSC